MSEKKFEEAMKELENIVEKLESGNVPLEESIELFEKGMELAKICSTKLEGVEQKIELLMEKNGKAEKVPFEDEE